MNQHPINNYVISVLRRRQLWTDSLHNPPGKYFLNASPYQYYYQGWLPRCFCAKKHLARLLVRWVHICPRAVYIPLAACGSNQLTTPIDRTGHCWLGKRTTYTYFIPVSAVAKIHKTIMDRLQIQSNTEGFEAFHEFTWAAANGVYINVEIANRKRFS